jgi:hypothetical protein
LNDGTKRASPSPGHHKTVFFSYAAVVILFFRSNAEDELLDSHKAVIDKVRYDLVPLVEQG